VLQNIVLDSMEGTKMTAAEVKIGKRQTALITGGSRGIGLDLAKQFALHGFDILLVARNDRDLAEAEKQLRMEAACQVTTIKLDLTKMGAPAELYREVSAKGMQIDILVNNAGMGDVGLFAESNPDRQLELLRLNILALTAITRLFLPDMLTRGRGRIMNVASLVAYFAGGANWASYVASKHYVLALTRGLARELSGSGVTVTALCPGATETDFVAQAGAGDMPIYRWLPKVSAEKVAAAGYRAVMAGKTTVVPGLLNKIFALLGELPPRAIAQSVFGLLSHSPAHGSKGAGRVS
jgi:short-subunit dehydrogenase